MTAFRTLTTQGLAKTTHGLGMAGRAVGAKLGHPLTSYSTNVGMIERHGTRAKRQLSGREAGDPAGSIRDAISAIDQFTGAAPVPGAPLAHRIGASLTRTALGWNAIEAMLGHARARLVESLEALQAGDEAGARRLASNATANMYDASNRVPLSKGPLRAAAEG